MINILQIEMENLKKEVDMSDIVSFDIFDTLVLRNVIQPTDVFKCVSIEYKATHHDALHFDFYKERIDAEMEARIRASGQEDIAYDEIYIVLEEKYGDVVKVLKEIELKLESKFIVPNNFMIEIYEYALSQNKRVFLLSDMYLPKSFLKSIMKQCGISRYEELIVSNDPMKTKHYGTIYPWMKEQYELDEYIWSHIGDNIFSDVKQANKHGVRGIYYQKISDRANINEVENIEESILKAIEINTEFTSKDIEYWEKFSIKYASKIYFALTYWLTQDVIEKKRDNIFFIARDGYIVYNFYQKFQSYIEKLPDSKYLYASRRGFQYPETIALLDVDEAIQTFLASNPQFNQKLTVKEVFLNLKLNIKKYEMLINRYDLEPDTIIRYEDGTYERAKKLFKELWPEIKTLLQDEKQLVEEYLKQEGVFDFENVNIFDVGWRGSIQKAVETITNKKIHGYYFGTSQWPHKTVQQNSTNFAINVGSPKHRMEHVFRNLMVYEFIFSAPHGSLINFKKDGNNIIPNLENVEDSNNVFDVLNQVHSSADKMLDQYLEYINFIKNFNPDFILSDLKNMLEEHPVEDMIAFSDLQNTVGFGNSRDKKEYVQVATIDEYIKNSKTLQENSAFNLWPNALLLTDGFRYFSQSEINTLYEIKKISKKNKLENKYIMHFKKMVKNREYKYYFKRVFHVFLYKIKIKMKLNR